MDLPSLGDLQPLWQWLPSSSTSGDHLALRTGGGEQQRQRLRREQIDRKSPGSPQMPFSGDFNDNYLNVQQDILETFVDRGQLRKPFTEPTHHADGESASLASSLTTRDNLALMHAPVFAHIAGGNTFTTAELYSRVLAVLGCPAERYTLALAP